MLSQQATDFFDDIKTLFKNSGETVSYVYHQIVDVPISRVSNDPQALYCRHSIIRLLILLKIANISSVHKCLNTGLKQVLPMQKDLLYKIKNCVKINWRRIMLTQAYSCMKEIEQEQIETPSDQPCFIIDDTDIPKTGRCMEFIGRIFSHANRGYKLGYKSLNLAYWTGKTTLHLDFSLHIEQGKNKTQGMKPKELANRFTKHRKKASMGQQRVDELTMKKTQNAIRMLRRAIAKGFQASYILVDSWFFSQNLVAFAISKNLHLISRPKFNNWKYDHSGKSYILGNLIKKVRYKKTKRKWNKDLRMHHVTVSVLFKDMPIKLFFYKEKKRGTKWHVIASTDKTIGAIQAFKIYQNRWSIEVSFKELKQHLAFGKCQSRDFDAQISDLTFCLMAYNCLSQLKAIQKHQSIGALFETVSKNWLSPNLMQRFWNHLYEAIRKLADLINAEFQELINTIFQSDHFFSEWAQINRALGTET